MHRVTKDFRDALVAKSRADALDVLADGLDELLLSGRFQEASQVMLEVREPPSAVWLIQALARPWAKQLAASSI